MSTKKYIVLIALAGLMFSCQKECIHPNNEVKADVETFDETSSWRTLGNSSNEGLTIGSTTGVIKNDKIDIVRNDEDDEITDPNNDDDRNKKKKN